PIQEPPRVRGQPQRDVCLRVPAPSTSWATASASPPIRASLPVSTPSCAQSHKRVCAEENVSPPFLHARRLLSFPAAAPSSPPSCHHRRLLSLLLRRRRALLLRASASPSPRRLLSPPAPPLPPSAGGARAPPPPPSRSAATAAGPPRLTRAARSGRSR
ncbi:hypothetical protein U9M48_038945, partial [Paspalum notatum var. saurae]